MAPERRSYDVEIAGIRVSIDKQADASMKIALQVERVATLQEAYVDQIKTCSDETKTNTNDITTLKTKQKFTQYIGGALFLGAIGYVSRNAIHWFKS